jgi:serine phosphatase RsbU (regulator of sigma subunit)
MILVAGFAGFIFRSLRTTRRQKQIIEVKSRETEEQKKIIEEKNKDITDSINYAKRIQQAKLPQKAEIFDALPHSFILYKPKDIVSGDFYFFAHEHDLLFIAAADCTGHGVPGAFMSMIGSEKLHDAVLQTADTSDILGLLNRGIKQSLRQSDSDDSTRDGMDIALCAIDRARRTVRYAGAQRPLWIVKKGANEVEEIKATKKAIGGLTPDDQHFQSHEVLLSEGDAIYIFSDGYADLFGGPRGKKITTSQLKQLLLKINDRPMHEQERYLNTFAEEWKAGTEQVDDILVIGIRL